MKKILIILGALLICGMGVYLVNNRNGRYMTDDEIIARINTALEKTDSFFDAADVIPVEYAAAAKTDTDPHAYRQMWLRDHQIKPNQNMFSFNADDIEKHKIPSYVVGCSGRADLFAKYAADDALSDIFNGPAVKISDIGTNHLNGHQIVAIKMSNGFQLINPGGGRWNFERARVNGDCKIGAEIDAIQNGNVEYKITAILTPARHGKIDSYQKLEDVYKGQFGTTAQRFKFKTGQLRDRIVRRHRAHNMHD